MCRIFPSVIASALVLSGCGQSAPRTFTAGDADRLDVADVNSRSAIHRVDALEARVAELEARLDQ